MDKERDREGQAFKVTDRRKFTEEGELKEASGPGSPSPRPPVEPPPPEPPPPEPPPSEPRPSAAGPSASPGDAPEMDFSSFLLSIATTAMMHMGEIPDPATGGKGNNLEAARQMIDTLTMLEEKTRGNLSADEAGLLENLLYELRVKFVSKTKTVQL
ncbi:MAG: DUF1844 domain-containing protein [Acidobacteriota bacterium]